MKYLYRGVSALMYEKLNGKLTPKKEGTPFSTYVGCGQTHAVCGSGVMSGKCDQNSIVLHQWKQEGHPTSGLSFTPHYDRALFYAKHGGKYERGYIFRVDVSIFESLGGTVYSVNKRVPAPSIPQDDEHILIAKGFGSIPDECVVQIEAV